jgi:sugar lactone lactonase YvrE
MTNDHPMKTITALGICLLIAVSASAQIPNFPTADLVLGQIDFTSDAAPSPPNAASLNSPFGIAVDPVTGKVWVADSGNNRVLRYASFASLNTGAAAEMVLGQATFADNSSNQGGAPASNTFANPTVVFVDSQGRLWVADAGNNRVLKFNNSAALSSNAPANVVFGQPDFVTATTGLSSTKLNNPIRMWMDQNDRLWVADSSNHRVLRFNNAPVLSNGSFANGVLGQPDFTTNTSGTNQTTMNTSAAVTVDSVGRLYVADGGNHRVLRFDNAATLADGAPANAVLGQPNFTLDTGGFSASKFTTPIGVFADASGALWVADAANSRVVRFDNAAAKPNGAPADGVVGQPDFSTTSSGLNAQKFGLPTSIWVDATGALWVADSTNNRILRFSPPKPDTTPPVIKVAGKKKITTTRPRLKIKGAASDASGIAEIRYKLATGGFKKAGGTTTWSFVARLRPGKNLIRVFAIDTVGNQSKTVKLRITRKPR